MKPFNGNGRTCGTCHPADNNFTIDPEFIAALPDDDPLFVAEFVPALAENFEKPELMRKVGLILENTNKKFGQILAMEAKLVFQALQPFLLMG